MALFPTVPLHAPATFAFVVAAPDEEVVVAPLLPPLEPPLDADDEVAPLPLDDEVDDEDVELESSSPPHDNVPERKRTATVP